jgi:hypothetical protein
MDGLDGLDGALGLGDILLERKGRAIEDDHVEAGTGGLFGARERVGVVGVEENGVTLVAIAFDERGGLGNAQEIALALGDARDNGEAQLTCGGDDGLQDCEFGEVKMPKGDASELSFTKCVKEAIHCFPSS